MRVNKLSKRKLIDDRFALTDDELITVNAKDLCEEFVRSERRDLEIKRLYNLVERLETLVEMYRPSTYRHLDLKA